MTVTKRHIQEDGIIHSHRRENHKSYIALTGIICSGDVMCLLWGTKWDFKSQKKEFFIAKAVKTSYLTYNMMAINFFEEMAWNHIV
jgi:hypothetical protein